MELLKKTMQIGVLDLQKEWELLHTDNEKYERYSLLIKLAAIACATILVVFSTNWLLSAMIIIVLWGQEAIWKTFQDRLCDRIKFVEGALSSDQKPLPDAFQFYSEWSKNRPSTVGTIMEYAKSALRPTVVYPYLVLMGVVVVL